MPCGEPITRGGGRICLGKHHDFDAVGRISTQAAEHDAYRDYTLAQYVGERVLRVIQYDEALASYRRSVGHARARAVSSSRCRYKPIRRRKRGYILTTDQSDAPSPSFGR
eukprot:2970542-Pyramimonas_sp.AAC.1